MVKFFKLSLILGLAVFAYGCAAPASQQAMTISHTDVTFKKNEILKNSVSVRNVIGGKSTNPLWTSQVDNEGFKGALEQSLAIVGYKASDSEKAKFLVDVELRKIEQPLIGIDFEVPSEVIYTVTHDGEKKQSFPVSAIGKAKFSDNWVGYERLKAANEKSIKENIIQFINQISKSIK